MKDFIFIAGAPGSGKSTVAKLLQEKLKTPIFEFGWIPEFRETGNGTTSYIEEESIAFENLTLVVKNYAKHGYKNVIITDLNNDYIEKLSSIFGDYDFTIYTLRLKDENVLKERVLDESRSSGYRNGQEAVEISKKLADRHQLDHEIFIDIDTQTADQVVDEILSDLSDS